MVALRADVSTALVSAQAATAAFLQCCEAFVQHLDVAFARIWTLNAENNVLELQASAGLYTHLNGPHSRVPVGQFKIGRIASTRQAHLTNAVADDPNVSDHEWATREGMVAFAGYPLLIEGRVVGVVAMFARHPLTEGILTELAPVIDGIAQYVERRRGEHALREAYDELEHRVQERTAELAHANRFLNALLENLQEGIVACDAEGVLTLFNTATRELHGLPQEPMSAERWADHYDLFRSDGTTRMLKEEIPLFRALRGERVKDAEMVIAPKGGQSRTLCANGQAFHDAQGRLLGAVVSMQDITRRKLAEQGLQQAHDELEARVRERTAELTSANHALHAEVAERQRQEQLLRASEERATNIVESIADGLITVDKEWRITYVNPRGEEILRALHKTDADIRGGNFWEEFPHTVGTTTEERYRRAVREQVAVQFETFSAPLGRWLDVRACPSRDGLSLYFLDITERKRAEEELRRTEERLRFVMDSMPQKIFTATPKGDVDYFNPQWMVFTGLSFEQIRDWGWTQFIHPEDVAENVRVWQHSIATGEPFQFEHRFRRADGEYRWHISRATALKDADGTVSMWVGSNTDIHEQKQTAIDLRNLAAALSEADRRKNEFLATLAHELRNPLAPIRNGLQILKLAPDDSHAIERARTMMERQLAQMVRLVDDLLDVNRITRNQLELRKERIQLSTVVKNAVETSLPIIEASGHSLEVSVLPVPIYLDADLTRLAQVFSNLLNNAAKYTERGGRIRLTVERQGHHVAVAVSDTGMGIPPAMLPRVFDMFTQVERTLERSQGGLGIGLTLVRRLVEMHGGSVEARSRGSGYGSEFIVRLPVVAAAVESMEVDRDTAGASRGRRRILVVDDNEDSAESLSLLLGMMDNEVRMAHDGPAAVDAAREFRPEIILLDIGLPGLNGYEACRAIRQQPGGDSPVIVACTGWGQDEDRRRSQEAGFDFHLVKPIDPAAIEKLLNDVQSSRADG